ncbi:hypothetical protein Desor_4241 [Desulfosporosinus orientis DSM 765]|uniref:FlgN protein n=1 Tax=Desulfosporosinus orientis (strain ATCC 19365 / DSM 765 / NCIMB 8382 / VKM B-1628 / Singapore I) TaxID=768706 RepID=G7WIU9_DESOD|nr:hypothetical protein [Desulfosporosinus orientis]AET69674.1 hypothetical protein Desor_4241 [Desulfosporosinus orientis DSM 765]
MEKKYLAFLKEKRHLVQALWQVTVDLTKAVEKEDYALVKKQLTERQRHIDQLAKLVGKYQELQCLENEETFGMRKDVNSMLELTVIQSRMVLETADRLKENAANKIRSVQLNKRAIGEGYFKRIPQSYGYFIDKKIGAGLPISKKEVKRHAKK